MIINTSNINDLYKLESFISNAKANGITIEVKKVNKQRTMTQNRALHLFCEMCANQLNDIGHTLTYTPHIKIGESKEIELMWTMELFKNYVWRDIQIQLYGKHSTKDLTTKECTEIADVVINLMARFEIVASWPSIENLING